MVGQGIFFSYTVARTRELFQKRSFLFFVPWTFGRHVAKWWVIAWDAWSVYGNTVYIFMEALSFDFFPKGTFLFSSEKQV